MGKKKKKLILPVEDTVCVISVALKMFMESRADSGN